MMKGNQETVMRRSNKSNNKKGGISSWYVTYSDMVTLLLTFFVLLFSMSTIDAAKWKAVVLSVQGALGVLDGGPRLIDAQPSDSLKEGEADEKNDRLKEIEKIDEFLKYKEEMKKLEDVQGKLKDYLASKGIETMVFTSIEERGLVLRFTDSVLFKKGRADLVEGSHEILEGVVDIINQIDNPLRIEGHTDNLSIHTSKFPSNWELSTTRATTVLQNFIKESVAPERLSAVGYGEFHPIAENDCEENRRKNRRVDIVIIRESLKYKEPQ